MARVVRVNNMKLSEAMKGNTGKNGGRPTKYKLEYADIARRVLMLRNIATDEDLAKNARR